MLIRAIALSVALLFGIGVIIPLATDNAEAGPRKHRHRKHYKKYSKQWWRQYRARQAKRRAVAARARALRLKQLRLAQKNDSGTDAKVVAATAASKPALLPSGDKAPTGWKAETTNPGELKFRVDDSAGSQVGSASISVVGPAMVETAMTHGKSVGGVPTTSLRREVINRMIQENGWVVNDYQKEIGGRQVYVVVAQSQAKNGRMQSRMFYFTEVDGRVYNVATNSPVEQSERLADESEKVINSIQARVRTTQRAALK